MSSQYDEDEFLASYFKGKNGTFLDVGALDGICCSNTHLLWRAGWRGLMVEANPATFQDLMRNFLMAENVRVLWGAVVGDARFASTQFWQDKKEGGWSSTNRKWVASWPADHQRNMIHVPAFSINEVYRMVAGDGQCDLLSIDTEGADAEILESMAPHVKPSLIVCETDKPGSKERCNAAMLKRSYKEVWTNVGNTAYACPA